MSRSNANEIQNVRMAAKNGKSDAIEWGASAYCVMSHDPRTERLADAVYDRYAAQKSVYKNRL